MRLDFSTGQLEGKAVLRSERKVKDLKGVYADERAWASMDPETLAYRVEMHQAEKDGTVGGLLFGTSFVMPGRVGEEYFMTKGHFHAKRGHAEYYWGISGQGWLLLMDEDRKIKVEEVSRGSLHYIPGFVAHRLINIGEETLAVGACWPSDAGHDYDSISQNGFSARVMCKDGEPTLIEN